jgi:hypothetical protein
MTSEEKLAVAERAYCKKIAEALLAYETDPRNFTAIMRARNNQSRRGALPVVSSYDER